MKRKIRSEADIVRDALCDAIDWNNSRVDAEGRCSPQVELIRETLIEYRRLLLKRYGFSDTPLETMRHSDGGTVSLFDVKLTEGGK